MASPGNGHCAIFIGTLSFPLASNSLPDFIRDPTNSTDWFRNLRTTYFVGDTSASRALGDGFLATVLYINLQTHSLTAWSHHCE